MEAHPLTIKNWLVVALIALAAGLWFVSAYLGIIAFAALMSFLFYGVYERAQKRMRSGLAATLTFLFSLVIVLVPVGIVCIFTASQLVHLTNSAASFGGDLPVVLQGAISSVGSFTQKLGLTEQPITSEGLFDFIKTTLPQLLRAVGSFLTSFVGSIPSMIVLAIMYIFLFFEFLVYGRKIISTIVVLSPFQPDITRLYLERIGSMANAMAKGQLAMAAIIAGLEAMTLATFFDIWQFFFLMAVTFTVLNLIPLGAGLAIYPLIIIFMVFGAIWPGVAALIAITIVSNLESFLRPKFIPKEITLSNGLTMLAAFSGISLFGVIGVVYGPIIMIIIVTTIQMYVNYSQTAPLPRKKAKQAVTKS